MVRACVRHVSSSVGIPLLFAFAAIHAGPARAAGESLDIPPGARQNGLGAAGVALFGDPSDAVWWNPAALGFADRTSVQYTHATLLPDLVDIPYHHAALAAPLGTFGGFGASFTRLDETDVAGPFGPGSFGDELAPSLALGVRVHPQVALGVNVKWIDLTYAGFFGGVGHAEGPAWDVGALARFDREPWRFGLGAAYHNVGGEIDFAGDTEPLGRVLRVGASASVPFRWSAVVSGGAVAVVDYVREESALFAAHHTGHGGLEVHVRVQDVLRFAARAGYWNDPKGQIQDPTFGAGCRAAMISLDAGWIPQSRDSGLPDVLKLTVGMHVDLSSGQPRWALD
jgi:hypothetical protein